MFIDDVLGDSAHVIPLHSKCIMPDCVMPPRFLVVAKQGHMFLCKTHATAELGADLLRVVMERANCSERIIT